MANTVKGSANKGFRDTHGKRPLPGGASSPDSIPGGSAGAGEKGASNVNGPGNGGESGSGFPASGSGRSPAQVSG